MGEDAKHDSLLDCDSSQEVPGKFLCRVLWLRLCVGGFLGGVSPCHLSSLSLGETALPSQARKLREVLLVCGLAHTRMRNT